MKMTFHANKNDVIKNTSRMVNHHLNHPHHQAHQLRHPQQISSQIDTYRLRYKPLKFNYEIP